MSVVALDAPVLEVRLFGQPSVLVGGTDITASLSKRALWMLGILALSDGKQIDRQHLASTLWPDSSESAALYNLRQTLAAVRRELGDAKDLCAASAKSVSLCASDALHVDVIAFDRLSSSEDPHALEEAVALYREPFLLGCEEPFAVVARERRELAFLSAAERLAAHYRSREDYQAAAAVLRRILSEDPYRESACRSIMSVLAESGEWPAALEAYRDFRRRLRRDLNTDVSIDAKALYRTIRTNALREPPKKGTRVAVPAPLTDLIGRQTEIGTVMSLLERCRLVTLCGPGGVGKTRLSIAIAHEVGRKYLDGAYFVDFALLQDSQAILAAITGVLHVKETGGRTAIESVIEFLAERELLLVLDNCEHVTDEAARLTEKLLSASSGVHVLATSRQTLGVRGEFVWNVPVLRIPSPTATADESLKAEAVQLFINRFRRQPGQLRDVDIQAVAAICRKLDGLPLAIELAAARTNVLSLQEIEKRLDSRFALLTGGSQLLQRHQTLRACMEWSWDMLSENEKGMLMSLSTFRGGGTLKAIESIAGDVKEDVLDILASLVDRSLISVEDDGNENRYSMLETVREFAGDRLKERALFEAAYNMHRDYFAAWAEEFKSHVQKAGEEKWFDAFESDHDNFRSAISWCYATGDAEGIFRFCIALGRFWDTHGHVHEGREQFERALAEYETKVSRVLSSHAHVHAGWIAGIQQDYAAAIKHYETAIPIWRELDEKFALGVAIVCTADAYRSMGEFDIAERLFLEALATRRSIGPGGGVMPFCNLADLSLGRGDLAKARSYMQEGIKAWKASPGERPQVSGLLYGVSSHIDYLSGRFEEAHTKATEALRIFSTGGLIVEIPKALMNLAFAEGGRGNWELAVQLLAAAEAAQKSQGSMPAEYMAAAREDTLARATQELGQRKFSAAYEKGRSQTVQSVTAMVL
jgi:predicted ATPase/DNA-binding SARP family transcriptional activator